MSSIRKFVFVVSSLFCTIFQSSSGIVPATRCNEGWSVLTSEKCIKLLVNAARPNRDPLLLNYQDAREHCLSQPESSSLLVLRSKEELAAVERLVLRPNNLINTGGSIWVDERQPRMFYEFRTIDNADMSDISDILRSGSVMDIAKNNNSSGTEAPRSCVRMMLGVRKELALSWRTESCSSKHPVVCEKEPLPHLDPQSVEELQVAYHNSKMELNETKTTVIEMAETLQQLKAKVEEAYSELDSLKERYKRSEVQILSNTLEIAKFKFSSAQSPAVGPGTEIEGEADTGLTEAVIVDQLLLADVTEIQESSNSTNGSTDQSSVMESSAPLLNKTEVAEPMIRPMLKCPPHHLPPIGFIYTQYPGQSHPATLWPTAAWKEITSQYAGMFFRAEGGSSSPFGEIQEDSAPHITSVHAVRRDAVYENIELTPGALSPAVTSGIHYLGYWPHWTGLRFNVSGGEVRPRNMAVRLFRRS